MTETELKQLSPTIRRDIVRMVAGAQSGHPGGSLGCVEYFVALYGKVMRYRLPFNKTASGEDAFYLSNGHISPVWYSTLARFGFFDVAELATFRKLDSRLQGHPTPHEGLPGIRVASGSLGQGLSVGVGHALAKRIAGDDGTIFVLTGDGELQEGQNWEAILFAAHNKVDNLIATVDYNGQQIDGSTEHVLSLENLEAKWAAFGWEVQLIKDGNNLDAVLDGLSQAKSRLGKGKPQVLLLHTQMGYGVDFMMGSHKWHGVAPNSEQLEQALDQLVQHATYSDY